MGNCQLSKLGINHQQQLPKLAGDNKWVSNNFPKLQESNSLFFYLLSSFFVVVFVLTNKGNPELSVTFRVGDGYISCG